MATADEIVATLIERRAQYGSEQQRMSEIRDLYEGAVRVALPELSTDERSVAANLVQLGIDQMGMRIASVIPDVVFTPERISDAAERRARLRRDVIRGWYHANRMHIKLYRRARWLVAFSAAPVVIRPGRDGLPSWQPRNPLGTFPAPCSDPDDIVPSDVIFTYRRSREALRRDYPEQVRLLDAQHPNPPATYELVEFVSPDEVVLLVVGARDMVTGATPTQELHRLPNRAGRPLAVIPGRVTLDRRLGQFDGLVGMYQMQARLLALYAIATEKAVFPEVWVQGHQGLGAPQVTQVPDAREGIIGIVENGMIAKIDMSPTPLTGQFADRLEYAERMTGAIPAEFGGFSTSNIRTGRRGDAVLSAAVDFRVQEAQQILQDSLLAENKIAIAVAKAYGGSRVFSMHVPGRGQLSYNPVELFPSDEHDVRYPYAGTDVNTLNVAVAQKIGVGILSRETAMQLDPLIVDAETERDRIVTERLEEAFLASIQAQAADPQGPYQPRDFARIVTLVKSDQMDLAEAVATVDEEIRERQAAQARGAVEQQELMPGLATPGAPGAPIGADMPGAPPQAAPSLEGLRALLGNLAGAGLARGEAR